MTLRRPITLRPPSAFIPAHSEAACANHPEEETRNFSPTQSQFSVQCHSWSGNVLNLRTVQPRKDEPEPGCC
ncbi:hypothetical protein JOB18_038822 [Solea senegalensis]|uniref:Uncharacterized protein n=1 Tax=Solea senegalensis TaxID=28829 RepID=A0AAV6Q3X4_SOLSE|nr:hypothetical protein JOB18_038822 [Solea senegalensis]